MSILTFEANAARIWFDEENMWVALTDGRQLSIPLVYFPRLLNATHEQRNSYELSGGGTGIHGEEIDEDIRIWWIRREKQRLNPPYNGIW